MDFFEDIAGKMYRLLQKKENAEQSYENYLQQSIPLDRVKEQLSYIELLNQRILDLQNEVQRARQEMNKKQEKLSDAFVEVKKFEKMISYRQQSEKALQDKQEKEFLDEISIRQYVDYKNR
ncbi:flagellar export protein FliJ [Virgibacillus halophilus]|uniref:Flagellar FliJ protein n=2 Tax=Tigheibacillus halophilus TaxID=361280 RepID=A0ABU5CAJ6_9BACI|nr:flagellar export protein FliJ [Virgibacillus halophilus]